MSQNIHIVCALLPSIGQPTQMHYLVGYGLKSSVRLFQNVIQHFTLTVTGGACIRAWPVMERWTVQEGSTNRTVGNVLLASAVSIGRL